MRVCVNGKNRKSLILGEFDNFFEKIILDDDIVNDTVNDTVAGSQMGGQIGSQIAM